MFVIRRARYSVASTLISALVKHVFVVPRARYSLASTLISALVKHVFVVPRARYSLASTLISALVKHVFVIPIQGALQRGRVAEDHAERDVTAQRPLREPSGEAGP